MPCVTLLLMLLAGPAAQATASPGVVAGGDLESLEPRLRSGDAEERRRAVVELPRIGSAEALERLVAALGDPEARVADQAQLALGVWPAAEHAPAILAALEARRGITPLRAAEALGRLAFPVEADALAAALRARDAEVRATLCFSIERLARAQRVAGDPAPRLVPALESLLRGREPRVRADALLALAALAPGRAEELAESGAADARPELRVAAAIAAGALPADTGEPLAARLSADDNGAVRVRAAQALARLGTRGAARALAARLAAEEEPRVARELVDRLRAISGLRHGRDPRPWADWASALPEGWRTAAEGGEGREADSGGTVAAFAGLPILSDRVAFLIDLSGSMWQEREAGVTRKQAVDAELERALMALPARARFNVIPFTGAPLAWRKALVPATERNLRDAVRAFQGQRARGQGDYWGALMLALSDPEVDTVVLFGDGAPSGGQRWSLELMPILLEHENRYRAVAVDAVLVDLTRFLERRWRVLCTQSGGRHIEVAL